MPGQSLSFFHMRDSSYKKRVNLSPDTPNSHHFQWKSGPATPYVVSWAILVIKFCCLGRIVEKSDEPWLRSFILQSKEDTWNTFTAPFVRPLFSWLKMQKVWVWIQPGSGGFGPAYICFSRGTLWKWGISWIESCVTPKQIRKEWLLPLPRTGDGNWKSSLLCRAVWVAVVTFLLFHGYRCIHVCPWLSGWC